MFANEGNSVVTNGTMYIHNYETMLMEYGEYRIKKWISTYVPPILLVIGTFGNILSFVILRKSMMRVSTYFYLAVLALADLLVLYIGLLRLWTGEITGVDIRNNNNWICKITIFLTYTASDFSVWLIVAVTVERYIAVCHPLKASILCSVQRARIVTISMLVILMIINSHFLITVHISDTYLNESSTCEAVQEHEFLVETVWPWVDTVMYSFAPYILLFNLNFWIIKQVVSAKKCRTQLQHCTSGRNNQLQKRLPSEGCIKLTIMLLAVSFSFIITTFPVNIYLILDSLWKDKNGGLKPLVRQALIATITELLMYTNHCINFYLYCATGKKFRNHMQKLVCKFKTYRQSHSGYSMSNHHMTRVSFSTGTGRSSIRHCGHEIRLLTKREVTRL